MSHRTQTKIVPDDMTGPSAARCLWATADRLVFIYLTEKSAPT